MSDYNKITNFTIKDSLPSGNTSKIIKGTELDNEFNAIQSAVSSKADANSPAFSGTPTAPTASSGTNNTQIATTAFVTTAAANAAAGVLVDGSVTTAKIADEAVTTAKIAEGVLGNFGPTFKAVKNSNQLISNSTTTKITFTTEEIDTNGSYSSDRFTPTIAGYYQVNVALVWNTNSQSTGSAWPAAFGQCMIYKNGSIISIGNIATTSTGPSVAQLSDVVYCNGSTDYIEIYGRQSSGASLSVLATHTLGGSTNFSAALVRNE